MSLQPFMEDETEPWYSSIWPHASDFVECVSDRCKQTGIMTPIETVLAVALGIGLSAAAGLRVFIPPLGVNIAALSGHLPLAEGFAWLGSPLATAALGTAALIEIGAYYIPWVDNLLDTMASPLAIAAGTLLTASTLGDTSPFMQWALALVAGGGSAGVVQGGTVLLRGTSSATTGGAGNPLVSTGEAGGAMLLTVLALISPLLALAALVGLGFYLIRRLRKPRTTAS